MFGFGPIGSYTFGGLPIVVAQQVVNAVIGAENPELYAEQLISVLENNSLTDQSIDRQHQIFNQWIPNTPEKVLTYITLITLILQYLSDKKPIEVNQVFINHFNIILEQKTTDNNLNRFSTNSI
jgi:hypothetical protein